LSIVSSTGVSLTESVETLKHCWQCPRIGEWLLQTAVGVVFVARGWVSKIKGTAQLPF
jgi:hypothetical protein